MSQCHILNLKFFLLTNSIYITLFHNEKVIIGKQIMDLVFNLWSHMQHPSALTPSPATIYITDMEIGDC